MEVCAFVMWVQTLLASHSMDFLMPVQYPNQEVCVFATWMYHKYNPYQKEPYMIPHSYTIAAYEEARKYGGAVSAEEILTTIVAEHGGGYPYPPESKECVKEKYRDDKGRERKRCKIMEDGEPKYIAWGLMQVSREEVKQYNEAHGTSWTMESVMDWRDNISVGAYTLSEIKHRHATRSRCTSKVKRYETVQREDGSLGLRSWEAERQHTFWAHYRCSVEIRDDIYWDPKAGEWKNRCVTTYRERLVKRFAEWEQLPEVVAYRRSEALRYAQGSLPEALTGGLVKGAAGVMAPALLSRVASDIADKVAEALEVKGSDVAVD